jgi:hypothetical protein
MFFVKRSRLKTLLGGWVGDKAGLRIAYSNQKLIFFAFKKLRLKLTLTTCFPGFNSENKLKIVQSKLRYF